MFVLLLFETLVSFFTGVGASAGSKVFVAIVETALSEAASWVPTSFEPEGERGFELDGLKVILP